MKTINRTVLFISPKPPYIDWANSLDDGGPKMSADKLHHTSILIPETYDEYNYENWLKKNFKDIFVLELESWMTDPEVWPHKLTYTMFQQWFEVRVADAAIDFGKKPLVVEEY